MCAQLVSTALMWPKKVSYCRFKKQKSLYLSESGELMEQLLWGLEMFGTLCKFKNMCLKHMIIYVEINERRSVYLPFDFHVISFCWQSRYLCSSGVVLLDKNQGFWLVHSTPHFPPVRQGGQYYYPSSGVTNGQNFICVTYPLDRFQTIGKTGVLHLAACSAGRVAI